MAIEPHGPSGPYEPTPAGGWDRRWLLPIAALAAIAGITVALVIAFASDDGDGDADDQEQVIVPTQTATSTPTSTDTPTESPTAEPTTEPTAEPTSEPTPEPDSDDDDGDEDGGDDDGDDDDGGDDDNSGSGEPARLIDVDPSGDRVVYLTFDAGSDTGFTVDILDFLAAEDLPGSFGLTGRWAEQNPDLVSRIVADGHVLFNHTYSHSSFTGFSDGEPLSEAERREEITRTDEIFVELGGTDGKPFWRPPFGDIDDAVPPLLGSLGYEYILMWTIDSLGWTGISEQEIADRVLGQMEPGAIVLLHVGAASQDFAALDQIVSALRADGYSFADIDALAD